MSEDSRELSYNRKVRVTDSTADPSLINDQSLMATRKRIDEYFETVAWPTITGLSLAIGFASIDEYSDTLEQLKTAITANPGDARRRQAYKVLTKARTRIILHYEEAMQSGAIQPAAGKFLLETLGIQPPAVQTAKEASSKLAAEAARKGAAKQLEAAREAGKVAKRAVGAKG